MLFKDDVSWGASFTTSSDELVEQACKRPRLRLGVSLDGLGQLVNLKVLNLSKNRLSGKGDFRLKIINWPVRFSQLPVILNQWLVILYCNAGEIPDCLGTLNQLIEPNLGHNQSAHWCVVFASLWFIFYLLSLLVGRITLDTRVCICVMYDKVYLIIIVLCL